MRFLKELVYILLLIVLLPLALKVLFILLVFLGMLFSW